jgi:4-aminobutyrate aminotransferase-like enzyme
MATSPEELGIENLEDWVATVPAPGVGAAGPAAIAAALARLESNDEAIAAYACDTVFSSDGILEPAPRYLASVYKAVRMAGGLCIADEVQAGFGRVGARLWGFAGHDVIPDIVTLGKPMGNGHPLAAAVTTAAIAEEFSRTGYYFSTFAGNPVSAAVGAAVLNVMGRERLPEQADRVGDYLRQGLRELATKYPVIADVRGPGMFVGVEVAASEGSPADLAHRIQNEMRNRRVLIGRTGPQGNVLKIRPPLVFAEKHANQLLETLGNVLCDL